MLINKKMSLRNVKTGDVITYQDNIVELINAYKNNDNTFVEIPCNQETDGVSPFHIQITCEESELQDVLNFIEKVINAVFKVNNISCIALKQKRKSKMFRAIYPEILLSYENEQRLIATLQLYNDSIEPDVNTVIPSAKNFKVIGMFNNGVLTAGDFLYMCSLNGITFDQALGEINHTVFRKSNVTFK